jgi:methylated-DNA-[protein]-cysteine S-methyltransferase
MNRKIIRSTPFGSVAILWDTFQAGPKITRVLLSKPYELAPEKAAGMYPDARGISCEEINSVARDMLRLLEGEPVDFSLDIAALDICGRFQQRVLRTEHAIPRGHVSTYKLIAAYLGVPKGARAVGNALANNPFPLIIPCHRAIRSDLTLGGYQGGLEMKHALLKMEGIPFDDSGRVKCSHFYYEKD